MLSIDADVLTYILYFYWVSFKSQGVREIWIKVGVKDTTRYIPIHILAEKIGQMCSVLPALHCITGCDASSKFGTKAAALKANPTQFLSDFGKHDINDEVISRAEEYLVKVLKSASEVKH